MEIDFDPIKSEKNREERGLPFTLVQELEWSCALFWPDTRKEYGEPRWAALVPLADRLYFVCYTWRRRKMRVISLRKANNREIDRYEQEVYP